MVKNCFDCLNAQAEIHIRMAFYNNGQKSPMWLSANKRSTYHIERWVAAHHKLASQNHVQLAINCEVGDHAFGLRAPESFMYQILKDKLEEGLVLHYPDQSPYLNWHYPNSYFRAEGEPAIIQTPHPGLDPRQKIMVQVFAVGGASQSAETELKRLVIFNVHVVSGLNAVSE